MSRVASFLTVALLTHGALLVACATPIHEADAPFHLFPEPMRQRAWAQQYMQEMDLYTGGVLQQRIKYSGNMWITPLHDSYGSTISKQSVDNGGVALCGTTQPSSSSYPQSTVRDGSCLDRFDEHFNCTDWAFDEQHIWQNLCVFQRDGFAWTAKFAMSVVPDSQDPSLPSVWNSTVTLAGSVSYTAIHFWGPCNLPTPTFTNCSGYC